MTRELETFLADETATREWVRYRHGQRRGGSLISVYLRKAERRHFDVKVVTNLDLATITAVPQGRGALTALLDNLEKRYSIYVENVLNPRLVGYLARRGYTKLYNRHDLEEIAPCFVKAQS